MKRALVKLSISAVLLLHFSIALAEAQTHSAVPVDLNIPVAPTPVKADGKVHLVYELHITNFDKPARDLTLTRVEVLGDGQDAVPLVRLVGEDLAKQMARPGAGEKLADKRRIAGGMRAVLFIWITVDSAAAVPRTLRHRLAFAIEKGRSKAHPSKFGATPRSSSARRCMAMDGWRQMARPIGLRMNTGAQLTP